MSSQYLSSPTRDDTPQWMLITASLRLLTPTTAITLVTPDEGGRICVKIMKMNDTVGFSFLLSLLRNINHTKDSTAAPASASDGCCSLACITASNLPRRLEAQALKGRLGTADTMRPMGLELNRSKCLKFWRSSSVIFHSKARIRAARQMEISM